MHEGHRQRLLSKLSAGENLYEHELLEILLFNAYPRKNVNPVAHALLTRFASIKAVLSADTEELMQVEGVGENVALYLKCIGRCLEKSNGCESFAVVKNVEQFKQFITSRFKGMATEFLEFYLLDKTGRVKRICRYTSGDTRKVEIEPDEILKIISVSKPYGLFVAHNHVTSPAQPSDSDDALTKQIQLICSMTNTAFYDHCIYTDSFGIFSYFSAGRIDKIKNDFNLNAIIRNA